jgi:hypothetical protein
LNDCERFFLKINRKYLIADLIAMAVFTVFGGGWLIAVIFYAVSIEVCGMNYLLVLHFSGDDGDALNLAKTLPIERRVFYRSYIKMMVLQTAVSSAVYATGTVIGNVYGLRIPFLPDFLLPSGTMLSTLGYYALILCLVLWVFIIMSGFPNRCSAIKRSMLIIGTIYIPIVFEVFYLLFLVIAGLILQKSLTYQVFAGISVAALFAMAAVFGIFVKRNLKKFVTK